MPPRVHMVSFLKTPVHTKYPNSAKFRLSLLFIPSVAEILAFWVGVEMPAPCTRSEIWCSVSRRCYRAGHVALCLGAEWPAPLGLENPTGEWCKNSKIPCKFPDTLINFPVPLRREFAYNLLKTLVIPGRFLRNPCKFEEFPCKSAVIREFVRDEFAPDCFHPHPVHCFQTIFSFRGGESDANRQPEFISASPRRGGDSP